MSVIDMIADNIGPYYDTDKAWATYARDHRAYLIRTSTTRTISGDYLRPHEYNLESYLFSINFDESAAWIVRFINGIKSNADFTAITSLRVPDISVIKQLYRLYQTQVQEVANA